jgi:ferredoxin
MSDFLAPANVVLSWIRGLARQSAVYFPQPAGKSSLRFERVADGSALQLDGYRPTLVPPGKRLAPAQDELLTFKRDADGKVTARPSLDTSPRVLAGVRTCDLRGIHLMDQVYRDGFGDPNYLARRQATTIIAVDCVTPCDPRCFCSATGALGHRAGADVFLTPSGADLLVEALTPAGERMVAGAGFTPCPDLAARRRDALGRRPTPFGRPLKADLPALSAKLQDTWKSPVWDAHVARCFSCGTCTMVCPTCYCFDVRDDLNFDLHSGNRARTWDSCMLPQFTAVAGGHNFRPDPAGRQRHRVKRKFQYLPGRFKEGSFCVGCGRCGRQCTTHIDILDIVNDVVATGA